MRPEAARAIPSYTGEVLDTDLGVTLIHEHIFVGDTELDLNFPHPEWDEGAAVSAAVRGLTELHTLGVDTVADLTVLGLGRNAELVARVAAESPVRILAATGYYAAEILPPFFRLNGPGLLVDGPEPLTRMFLSDIREGIAGTGVRAAIIKIASDETGITPDIERVFRAAATAQLETGVPILTHSHAPSQNGTEQQDLLERLGVPLERTIIGHAGDSADLDYLMRLADRGSMLGFDRFGMTHVAPDEQRIDVLVDLCNRGYADRIAVSHDAAFFSRVTPPSWRAANAPEWSMDHISRRIRPALRERNLDDQTLHQLLVENPRRILTGK